MENSSKSGSGYGDAEQPQFLVDVSVVDELLLQGLVWFCLLPVPENLILAVSRQDFLYSLHAIHSQCAIGAFLLIIGGRSLT